MFSYLLFIHRYMQVLLYLCTGHKRYQFKVMYSKIYMYTNVLCTHKGKGIVNKLRLWDHYWGSDLSFKNITSI
jgi:hypothetical protein